MAAGIKEGGSYSDLFFENTTYQDLLLRDGIVSSGGFHIDYGVGIRVLKGDRTGYAYSESTDAKSMSEAVKAAALIAASGPSPSTVPASLRFAPCPGKCPPEGSPSPAATKYEICNVDITIALQAPKLRPYIDTMRETLAEIMNIDKSQVSVKATTTERLGFVGRGEGCEVWATVLIARNDIYQY